MGKIVKVSGPLVVASGLSEANMADVVRVGEQHLIGEILTMSGDSAAIQVYEETSGLGPGAEVVTTGAPLSVELGPGLIENIYDGIQRPLEVIRQKTGGNFLPRGEEVPALDREKKWDFTAVAKVGDHLIGGDVLGTVQETPSILHKIMMPPKMSGTVKEIKSGSFTVEDVVAVIETDKGETKELTMIQKWPVRVGRPYTKKYPPVTPLQSGQRIVDTFFPVAKGGTAAIPGPFGSGKTVTHQGDKTAREALVKDNLGLVWSIVKRFAGRGYEQEDLFQIGSIGLIKAIDNFDITQPVRFSTYAVPMIQGELRRYLRDNSPVRVSRSMRDLAYRAMQARERLTSANGREPTIEAIAKEIGAERSEVVIALEAVSEPISLYEPVFSESGDTIYVLDQLGDHNDDDNWLDEISLKEAIHALGDREKHILNLRFFRGKTQVEVAKEIGISQAQVSRLEKGALQKIKNRI